MTDERSERSLFRDRIYMNMALELAKLSTCSRRAVGTIIVDSEHRIIGSGYNGVLPDMPHCKVQNPEGKKELCHCLHSEDNASSLITRGHNLRAYVSTFPCEGCMRLLISRGIRAVYYASEYTYFEASKAIAEKYGVKLYPMLTPGDA